MITTAIIYNIGRGLCFNVILLSGMLQIRLSECSLMKSFLCKGGMKCYRYSHTNISN